MSIMRIQENSALMRKRSVISSDRKMSTEQGKRQLEMAVTALLVSILEWECSRFIDHMDLICQLSTLTLTLIMPRQEELPWHGEYLMKRFSLHWSQVASFAAF
jgi:hypothetical protein